jgi:hypothetical protein
VIRDAHRLLRLHHGDSVSGESSFLVGRSTANQRIEMFWSVLKKLVVHFRRNFFKDMVDIGLFNITNSDHVETARLCFTRPLQTHLDVFKQHWNHHNIRRQRSL